MECKQTENKLGCNCTANCDLAGICCDCVSKHRDKGQIPGCFFTKAGEALLDRSVETFIADTKNR